jgi:hypothetical protein
VLAPSFLEILLNADKEEVKMEDLKKVLEIFLKYDSRGYIAAEHDVIYFCGSTKSITVETLTEEDKKYLTDETNVYWDKQQGCWAMFV